MPATFGLDFGTTNSVVTYVDIDPDTGQPCVRPLLDDEGRSHPSVVWYRTDQSIVGREAKKQLGALGPGVFGNIVRSPKTFLGKPAGMPVGEVAKSAIDVVADILRFLRRHAIGKNISGNTFEDAVVTIPVSMDGIARRELRDAARKAEINVYQYVHEPLAALYGYLRGLSNFHTEVARLENEIMLVFDWGGGTLDLTLCRLERGILTQIANSGDSWDLGGDNFDKIIQDRFYAMHEIQHPELDWNLLQDSANARIIEECELTKIVLSSRDESKIFLPNIFATAEPYRDMEFAFTRNDLELAVSELVRAGVGKIEALLKTAGLSRDSVKFCLATGGMVEMPSIKQALQEKFGMRRVRFVDNSSTIISEGAAWIAHDDIRIKLAKPFEVLAVVKDSDTLVKESYVSIIHAGTELPTAGKSISQKMSMYCVDPSDGFAKFLFARPQFPNRETDTDPRIPYLHVTLPVDAYVKGRQLLERLGISVSIDDNLVATIHVEATGRREEQIREVHNLEFGLSLGLESIDEKGRSTRARGSYSASSKREPGALRVRSNVAHTNGQQQVNDVIPTWLWELVPGEIVELYNPHHRLIDHQKKEKNYYALCRCGRTYYQIMKMGGDCGCKQETFYENRRDVNFQRTIIRNQINKFS